ncbi:uncharacterized protein LOC123309943 [Coccinella septempunctata]|uniref:uncharacterized protein LOC123309943 n=1 Tax=Coccinella septempunctata TaxID=41139 RepID=UPI001D064ACF|nr:uncharacterized protein LOC123309943 [Coccinella septempunctata]
MQSDYNVENVTIMSLNQMCDLALGFVNPGIIHFDLLHQMLQAIIQQCNLIDVKIKIGGDKSAEIQKFTAGSRKTSQGTLSSVKGTNPFSTTENSKVSVPEQDTNVIILDQSSNKPLEHTVSISVEQMQWIINSIVNLQTQINEMKHFPNNQDIIETLRESGQSMSDSTFKKMSQKATESIGGSQKQMKRSVSDTPLVDMFQISSLTKRVDAAEDSIAKLASLVEDLARDSPGSKGHLLEIESLSELKGESIAIMGNRNALELLAKEVQALKRTIYSEEDEIGSVGPNLLTKIAAVDVKLRQTLDQVEILDRLTSEQLCTLFGQCDGLENSIIHLEQKLMDIITSHKAPLMSLNEKYNEMRDQVDNVLVEQKKIMDTNAQREMKINSLIEQVEVLKTTKVNQEQFEIALESKLDADKILTKVSQEKFDKTYEELKVNIDETITKLRTQEDMWQRALIELQNEMVTKLEKNELTALQEFVKGKLKVLRDKVRSMKIYQSEQEAAATKQELIKNVKCLSCDADVSTRTRVNPRDYPRSPVLPPTRTIAPYLAYELDVMRKQQRGQAYSRNMHHFEATVRNKEDRFENRYCGGPHTVTTPVQRVTRLGHFLEQWGPEMETANENFIKGTDQKVYLGGMRSGKGQAAMRVEGDILKDKKDQQEEVPEKDSMVSKSDMDREMNGSINSDDDKLFSKKRSTSGNGLVDK